MIQGGIEEASGETGTCWGGTCWGGRRNLGVNLGGNRKVEQRALWEDCLTCTEIPAMRTFL